MNKSDSDVSKKYKVTVKALNKAIICNKEVLADSPKAAVAEALSQEGFDVTVRNVVKMMRADREIAVVQLVSGPKLSETYYNVLF